MRIPPIRSGLRTLLIFIISANQAYTQPVISPFFVSASLLRKHVFLLASDSLQGRATGTVGQLKAAIYCTQAFRKSHLLPAFRLDSIRGSFRQTYAFTITDVALFGSSPVYGPTYKRHELAAFPITKRDSNQVFFGENVTGLLIGTDLKQEVLVLSAHYDHLGHSGGRIFHGADDNASGTAAILSVAAAFDSLAQQGVRPRRSLLFVLFSGEEGGLLGSQFFVDNSPIPLKQIVCNLNVDMVGRVDDAHRKRPDYCYLLTNRQGDGLQRSAETANQQSVNLTLNQGGYDTKSDPK